MIESEGIFLRQHQGKGYAAKVRIHLVPAEIASVAVGLENTGPPASFSQGDIQKAYTPDYDDWIQGAVIGARYALAKLPTAYAVTLTAIEGSVTDTNPTVVAAAAISAIWKGAGYTPLAEDVALIEGVVFVSWDQKSHHLPKF
jgi:hypothetical protein